MKSTQTSFRVFQSFLRFYERLISKAFEKLTLTRKPGLMVIFSNGDPLLALKPQYNYAKPIPFNRRYASSQEFHVDEISPVLNKYNKFCADVSEALEPCFFVDEKLVGTLLKRCRENVFFLLAAIVSHVPLVLVPPVFMAFFIQQEMTAASIFRASASLTLWFFVFSSYGLPVCMIWLTKRRLSQILDNWAKEFDVPTVKYTFSFEKGFEEVKREASQYFVDYLKQYLMKNFGDQNFTNEFLQTINRLSRNR